MSVLLQAYSGANQTTIRAGEVGEQFAVFDVPTTLLQFQPTNTGGGASLTYGAVVSGSYTSVYNECIVMITPTSDWKTDWILYGESTCHYGRVRITPTATGTLAIGYTDFEWDTSMYVTVLSTVGIHFKPLHIIEGSIEHYKDYNGSDGTAYRRALPRIHGVQSAYVEVTNGTASISISASASAEASGATISSWATPIALRGNATISGSSGSYTVSLASGLQDWIRLSVTDSNSNTTVFYTFVASVPHSYTGLQAVALEPISATQEGHTASFTTYTNTNIYFPRQRVLLASNYSTGSFSNNIDFVGQLSEDTNQLAYDANFGQAKQVSLNAESLIRVADRLSLPGLPIVKGDTPEWGYFNTLNVFTAIWYIASELTTAHNVISFSIASGYTNYQSVGFTMPDSTGLLGAINTIASTYAGSAICANSGAVHIARDLFFVEDATTKNSATTIATLTTADANVISVRLAHYASSAGVILGAGYYDSTADSMVAARVTAPKKGAGGLSKNTVNSQIFASDDDTNFETYAGKRAAQKWLQQNPLPTLDLELLGGYRDIYPSHDVWYVLDFAGADNLQGITWSSTQRWLCIAVTKQHNANGYMDVRASFVMERNADTYAVLVQFARLTVQQRYPTWSTRRARPWIDADGGGSRGGSEHDDTGGGNVDNIPPEITDITQPPPDDVFWWGTISSKGLEAVSDATVSGTTYEITCRGYFREFTGWCYLSNFGVDDHDWETEVGSGKSKSSNFPDPSYIYEANRRMKSNKFSSGGKEREALIIVADLQSEHTLTSINIDRYMTPFNSGNGRAGGSVQRILGFDNNYSSQQTIIDFGGNVNTGERVTQSWTGSATGVRYIYIQYASHLYDSGTMGTNVAGDPKIYIYNVNVCGSPRPNPFGEDNTPPSGGYKLVDAFYEETGGNVVALGNITKGLQINSSAPSILPAYSGSKSYIWNESGTGGTFTFKFADSDYTDNELKYFRIEMRNL